MPTPQPDADLAYIAGELAAAIDEFEALPGLPYSPKLKIGLRIQDALNAGAFAGPRFTALRFKLAPFVGADTGPDVEKVLELSLEWLAMNAAGIPGSKGLQWDARPVPRFVSSPVDATTDAKRWCTTNARALCAYLNERAGVQDAGANGGRLKCFDLDDVPEWGSDDDWVLRSDAVTEGLVAETDVAQLRKAATQMSGCRVSDDGLMGVDALNRRWRRKNPTKNSHVYLFRADLKP